MFLVRKLLIIFQKPYEDIKDIEDIEDFQAPADANKEKYQTFCGT